MPSKEDLEEDPRLAAACASSNLASAHSRGGARRTESEEMLPRELQGQVGMLLGAWTHAALLGMLVLAPSKIMESILVALQRSWKASLRSQKSILMVQALGDTPSCARAESNFQNCTLAQPI